MTADAASPDTPTDPRAARLRAAADCAPQALPPVAALFVATGLRYAADVEAFEDDTLALADEVLSLSGDSTQGTTGTLRSDASDASGTPTTEERP